MNTGPDDRDALLAYLDFHVEAGVGWALDERPHDRFAEDQRSIEPPSRPAAIPAASRAVAPEGPLPPSAPATSAPRPLPRAAAAAPEQVALAARDEARRARSLDELEALIAAFEGCALKFGAKNLAFSDGDPSSRLMLVGEAPGADEDRVGKPFVGRSGQLLNRMLAAIGLGRTDVYIANVVPWRPPGNRTPTPQEVAICRPFIARQIELADPDILVCLGGPATQALLNHKDGILKTRGRWTAYHTGTREIRALATLHPAYLLRQPLQKRLGWRDFRAIKRALESEAGPEPAGAPPLV